jgi:hypothetical protein
VVVDNYYVELPNGDVYYAGGRGKCSDFLYVMQNSAGLIKIGRSINPDARRRTLELSCGMRVELVLKLAERGSDEREVQGALWRHVLIGEWFKCNEESKEILRAIFSGHELRFPYPKKMPTKVPVPLIKKNGKKRATRVVSHRLADGSTKVYKYGPYPYKIVKDKSSG